MLSAREAGPRAPGWLLHIVDTVVLSAQPEPWAQDVHFSPRGLLLPMGFSGFPLASSWHGGWIPRDRKRKRQFFRAWVQILAQHLIYCIHLSNSPKAVTGGGEADPTPQGEKGQRIWGPCFKTATEGHRQDQFWRAPPGQAGYRLMPLMKLDGKRSMW